MVEVDHNNPDVAIRDSQAFQDWAAEFNRRLRSAVYCEKTRASDFVFKVKYSVIKDNCKFWISGDSYCEIIPKDIENVG